MKIAYLSTFYPFRGGIAQFNAALYREFESKYDTKAFTFLRQYPDLLFPGSSQYVQPDDKVDTIPAERVLDTINPVGYIRAASKVNAFAPDLLLTKFWMPFFGPSLGTVCKRMKPETVKMSILDNVKPHEPRKGDITFTKYFLNHNDAFVVMSDTVEADLLELKPDARFIRHIHPLYDHFGAKEQQKIARDKMNVPFDKKILLFFGFIRDYKGLDILLQAMTQLPEDYHLLIAGEVYGKFDKYDKIIKDNNLEERVTRQVRYISDDEVPLCFAAADICVLPYRSATQSGITSIAYHFEVPIVATNVGSLREMIEPNDTGYLVAKPDPSMIASAVREVFDKGLILKYISNIASYKRIASWSSLANSITDLYYEIINERYEKPKKK